MSVADYQAKANSIVDEIIEAKELYKPNWFGAIPNVKQNDFDNPKQSRQIKNHNCKHIPTTYSDNPNQVDITILPKNYKPKACIFCQVRTIK